MVEQQSYRHGLSPFTKTTAKDNSPSLTLYIFILIVLAVPMGEEKHSPENKRFLGGQKNPQKYDVVKMSTATVSLITAAVLQSKICCSYTKVTQHNTI